MNIQLTPVEARVLGSLIEKEVTTPDNYPLSLSALIAACNQKSNRDPVMNLGEEQILEALDGLTAKHLTWERTPSGSRVTKYAHRLSNALGLQYDFTSEEIGVLCVLMLRGPQTVGEIRARSDRLCKLDNLSEVERVLQRLSVREDGPYVAKLARRPGRKESRYSHLLCGGVEDEKEGVGLRGVGVETTMEERVSELEQRVEEMSRELAELRGLLR